MSLWLACKQPHVIYYVVQSNTLDIQAFFSILKAANHNTTEMSSAPAFFCF